MGAKNWTSDKVDRARVGTVAVVVKGVQIAHDTAGRIIGQDRATYLFTSFYLPVQQAPAIVPASTMGTTPKPTAGAGKLTESKVGGKITEVKAPTVVNGAIAG